MGCITIRPYLYKVQGWVWVILMDDFVRQIVYSDYNLFLRAEVVPNVLWYEQDKLRRFCSYARWATTYYYPFSMLSFGVVMCWAPASSPFYSQGHPPKTTTYAYMNYVVKIAHFGNQQFDAIPLASSFDGKQITPRPKISFFLPLKPPSRIFFEGPFRGLGFRSEYVW